MPDLAEPRSPWPPLMVADLRDFLRGCLACWLHEFNRDSPPIVTADAVQTVERGNVPVPLAVILSASPGLEGRTWVNQQVRGLQQMLPEVPIVLIIDELDTAAGQELAVSLGVQGFIPMSTSLEVAFAALRLVIVGGQYLPHSAVQGQCRVSASAQPTPTRGPKKLALTPRERAVCELLSEGLPNKLIARGLGMALSTVKVHVHHILEKLDVQNRTELAIRVSSGSPSRASHASERPGSRQLVVHGLL